MAQGKCIQCRKAYNGAMPGEEEEDKCPQCVTDSKSIAFKVDMQMAAKRAAEGVIRNPRAEFIQSIIHGDQSQPVIIKASDIQSGAI